jgi:predicted Zn-dependent protease
VTEKEHRHTPEPEQADDTALDDTALDDTALTQSGQAESTEPTEPTEERPPGPDPRIEDLRDMEEKGDHLGEVIEDARGAVAAAHRANSMRLSDGTGDVEEPGPQAAG